MNEHSAFCAVVVSTLLSACSGEVTAPIGCQSDPLGCVEEPPVARQIDVLPAEVGPSPLRRLSNHEYLSALQDLFPDQQLELPTLPNDGEVGGFDNAADGQTPSDVRIARYEATANLYASSVTSDTAAVRQLVGCNFDSSEQAELCRDDFIANVGRRLFRRPLAAAEHDGFAVRFQRWARQLDFEGAVQLTLSAMLQSPQFLYRLEPVAANATPGSLVDVEPYAMASRLSFFLWASTPDETLLSAAANGELSSETQIREQASRMLRDPRAKRVMWDFHRQWLGLDRVLGDEHLVRTPAVDPSWTPARQAAVHRESQLFVENVLMDGGSLRELLLSRRAWLNADLMELYGLPTDPEAEAESFHEVSLPETERAGILTRAAFLAGYSHRGATSPPIRANEVRLRLFCRPPAPPPASLDTTPPVANPDAGPQTNRMLFEARTAGPACRGCHLGLNGIGFGFENFTAAGKFTLVDQGLPVDATGHLYGTDVDGPFAGANGLSERLSASEDAHHCASSQWVRYALGRAPIEGESKLIDTLTTELMKEDSSVQALLLRLVTSPSFRYQHVEET